MLIDLNCTIVCIVLCKQGRCRGEKFENAAGYRGVLEWYIRRHSFCGVRQAEPRPVSRIACVFCWQAQKFFWKDAGNHSTQIGCPFPFPFEFF